MACAGRLMVVLLCSLLAAVAQSSSPKAPAGTGAPKPTCHHRRRHGRTFSVLDGLLPLAAFEVITEACSTISESSLDLDTRLSTKGHSGAA